MAHKITVIYHSNCPDGFSAAWAAWKKFGKKAKYVPQEHHTPPPTDLDGKDVYLLDFCFPAEVTNSLLQKVKNLTIIDHHITAKNIVESVRDHLFDNGHSGAVLAWQYFHPKKTVPKLLQYVEDADLWKFKLKNTKEINSAIPLYSMEFGAWSKLARTLENPKTAKKVFEQGKAIIEFKTRIINEMVEGAELVEFEGYRALLTACPTTIHSELGNALVKKLPPIGIVYRRKGEYLKVSLRSDGTVDVAQIAQKYGGGGHRAAAGFQVRIGDKYPWVSKNQIPKSK